MNIERKEREKKDKCAVKHDRKKKKQQEKMHKWNNIRIKKGRLNIKRKKIGGGNNYRKKGGRT